MKTFTLKPFHFNGRLTFKFAYWHIYIFIHPINFCGIFVLHFAWHGIRSEEPGKLLDFRAAWFHLIFSCSSPSLQGLQCLPSIAWSLFKVEEIREYSIELLWHRADQACLALAVFHSDSLLKQCRICVFMQE